MAAVTAGVDCGNAVWRRLLAPSDTVTFTELARRWRSLEISCAVEGHAAAADHPGLLGDLRGALGRVLMAGASPASLAEEICDWKPPCANDVLFGPKPALKVSRHTHEIPKPFVVRVQKRGDDLILTVLLFGFAREWASEIRAALAEAARERLDWKRLAQNRFLPAERRIGISQRDLACDLGPVPARTVMRFITPIDCKNADPADRPESVLSRLASRIWLLARWHDVTIEADWPALLAAWRGTDLCVIDATAHALARNSTRTAQTFIESTRLFDLSLDGELAVIWPLLVIGKQSQVGRGTTIGLGRYVLLPGDA